MADGGDMQEPGARRRRVLEGLESLFVVFEGFVLTVVVVELCKSGRSLGELSRKPWAWPAGVALVVSFVAAVGIAVSRVRGAPRR